MANYLLALALCLGLLNIGSLTTPNYPAGAFSELPFDEQHVPDQTVSFPGTNEPRPGLRFGYPPPVCPPICPDPSPGG